MRIFIDSVAFLNTSCSTVSFVCRMQPTKLLIGRHSLAVMLCAWRADGKFASFRQICLVFERIYWHRYHQQTLRTWINIWQSIVGKYYLEFGSLNSKYMIGVWLRRALIRYAYFFSLYSYVLDETILHMIDTNSGWLVLERKLRFRSLFYIFIIKILDRLWIHRRQNRKKAD